MTRSDLTEKLLDAKREKGWSWKYICENIGGYSEVLIVGAILGQMKLTKPQAAKEPLSIHVVYDTSELRVGDFELRAQATGKSQRRELKCLLGLR